jgi:hypothetical protein
MAKAKRALASAHKLLQDNDGDLQIRVSEKPIVEIVLLDAKEARPRLFSAHFYPDRSRQRKSDIRCAPLPRVPHGPAYCRCLGGITRRDRECSCPIVDRHDTARAPQGIVANRDVQVARHLVGQPVPLFRKVTGRCLVVMDRRAAIQESFHSPQDALSLSAAWRRCRALRR